MNDKLHPALLRAVEAMRAKYSFVGEVRVGSLRYSPLNQDIVDAIDPELYYTELVEALRAERDYHGLQSNSFSRRRYTELSTLLAKIDGGNYE